MRARMTVPILPAGKFEELKDYLKRVGFSFEDRPNQLFLARAPDLVVSLYASGKVVIAGKDRTLEREVRWYLSKLGAIGEALPEKLEALKGRTRIGTDEAGKGDYFGPLVVAGVVLDERAEKEAMATGVRDSKALSDAFALDLSFKVREVAGRGNSELLRIFPEKYNEMYSKMGNVNHILAWAHARVIEVLLGARPDCRLVVVDQFSARSLEAALSDRGRSAELVQSVRGERDAAVACASILARAGFLDGISKLGDQFGTAFPKGAAAVVPCAREFVKERGAEHLGLVAKLHFRTTQKVLGP
jgi:ribonuclease HIII